MRFSAVLAAPVFFALLHVAVAEDFVIDEFEFTWKVAAVGKSGLSVTKTQDSTLVVLNGDMEWVRMKPTDASAVGAVLAQSDERYAAMRAKGGEARETVSAGDIKVSFWLHPEHGFNVSISPAKRIFGGSILLDRKEAKAFGPWLQKAEKLAAFVDAKIKP